MMSHTPHPPDIPTLTARAREMLRPENIPQDLKNLPQWICWQFQLRRDRNGRTKVAKVPMQTRSRAQADVSQPSTWCTFDEALEACQRRPSLAGIGFVFTSQDELAGIDLDECRDTEGRLCEPAVEIVQQFNSYTEVSPSGTGVKIYLSGAKPPGVGCRSKAIVGFKETEVYDCDRFFAVTGCLLEGSPTTVEHRQEQLEQLCWRLWPPKPLRASFNGSTGRAGFSGTDDELIEAASRASNGSKFQRLWAGDTSMHADDDSSADMALCALLAFWTGRDADRMDRLFRQSGLMREKWDERRGDSTYGGITIRRAIEGCMDVYAPTRRPRAVIEPLDGPCGIRLIAMEVDATPKRHTARFEVHLDEQDTGAELAASDSASGKQSAAAELLEIVREAKEIDETEVAALRAWLSTVLTRKRLSTLKGELERYERHRSSDEPAGPTMFDITLAHVRDALHPAFVDTDGRIWCEALGRCIDRNEFPALVDSRLRRAAENARDYPAPTPLDPTKPIRHLQQELRVVWAELVRDLPDEIHADLGPATKAAARFRQQIIDLWLVPETWIKVERSAGDSVQAERMSLASRVRVLAQDDARHPGAWRRVLRGADAFYRVDRTQSGATVIWLGMRAALCRDQVKAHSIPIVGSQADLTTLVCRYGLADDSGVPDRLRDDGQQSRVVVLSRALCDYLIECVDDTAVTAEGPRTVTALDDGCQVDLATGELVQEAKSHE